jgi:hypothetical protein
VANLSWFADFPPPPSFVFELLFQLVGYNTDHQQNAAEQDDQLYAL